MFGRYSLDVEGLAYAGGEWVAAKYKTFQPDRDAILPICDDDYFEDDIMGRFLCRILRDLSEVAHLLAVRFRQKERVQVSDLSAPLSAGHHCPYPYRLCSRVAGPLPHG